MPTTISICSERGVRDYQEDSYGLFRLGQWECFAIADGYGSQHHQQPAISSDIIAYLLQATTATLPNHLDITDANYQQFFVDLFDQIDGATIDSLPGSTLAVAFHNRRDTRFYTAALGDSIIAHLGQQVATNPHQYLHQGKDQLWGSFGDTKHAEHHSKQPECHIFNLEPQDALLIGSDGMFATHEKDKLLEELQEFTVLVQEQEYTAADLVHHAHHYKQSDDNATAILIRLQ